MVHASPKARQSKRYGKPLPDEAAETLVKKKTKIDEVTTFVEFCSFLVEIDASFMAPFLACGI